MRLLPFLASGSARANGVQSWGPGLRFLSFPVSRARIAREAPRREGNLASTPGHRHAMPHEMALSR